MAKKKVDFSAAVGVESMTVEDSFVSGAPDATAPKPEKEKLTRVNIDVSADLYHRFKMLALQRGTTVRQMYIDFMESEVSK